MKKLSFIVLFILISVLICFVFGCGKTVDSTGGKDAGGTQLVIKGTLNTGTISTSSLGKVKKFSALADHNVALVNVNDNKVYLAEANSNGDFSKAVPTGSYMMAVLDDNFKLTGGGPISLGDFAGKKVMAIKGDAPATINVGDIVVDRDKGAGELTEAITANILDTTYLAEKTADNVTRGTGKNLGKGFTITGGTINDADGDGITDDKDPDGDNDGLFNDVDADDDSDGYADGIKENGMQNNLSSEGHIGLFMNLGVQHENIEDYNINTSTIVTIEWVLESSSSMSNYSSVKIIKGPSWLATATTTDTGNPLWSQRNYALEANTAMNRFEEWIVPNAAINAGDTLIFEITKTDGTVLTIMEMINYVYTNPPIVQSVNGVPLNTTSVQAGDLGTGSNPLIVTENFTITWNLPKDESGNYITGMRKYWNMAFFGSSTAQIDSESVPINATETNGSVAYTLDLNTLSSYSSNKSNINNFKIDIDSTSYRGDHAFHMLNFKLQ